ncbi:RluA family pseudouridine synthase [Parvularcula sp. LCG005]|uniref:RluA family pseudouridine synthase n=1 Tax=Parvularcula sp. LCG005 TaxID=3078805 RepID=UPI002943CC0A|nr:RluA family pseudouridine synthase [Parvularcula sp. LCG005]WOI52485.1 RluA family pseudouridine synthase [Parvularcula sp. LCG005]
MSDVQMVTVRAADDGMRLDRWFRQHYPNIKHGALQKMLRKGQVRVDGGRVQADRRLCPGEVVRVPPIDTDAAARPAPKPRPTSDDADFIRSLVLYEDSHILVLNKPFGLAVQGGAKTTRHIDGMLGAFEKNGERPRLVHRLDRDTGGVLVLAKTRIIAAALGESFKSHHVEKIYWALTSGVPYPWSGRIDLKLEKQGEEGAEKMRGSPKGQRAITDFQVVEPAGQKAAFVAVRPETGRTHQIRVHLSAAKAPIVGDRKYGGEKAVLEGVSSKMHLFCRQMTVPLPGRKPVTITAPLTGHMEKTWKFFGFSGGDNLDWPDL